MAVCRVAQTTLNSRVAWYLTAVFGAGAPMFDHSPASRITRRECVTVLGAATLSGATTTIEAATPGECRCPSASYQWYCAQSDHRPPSHALGPCYASISPSPAAKKGATTGNAALAPCWQTAAVLTVASRWQFRTMAMRYTTVEGLGQGRSLNAMQAAFIEHDGFQCGYCTPGQTLFGRGSADGGPPGGCELCDGQCPEYRFPWN